MLEQFETVGEITDTGFRFDDSEHVRRVMRGFKRGKVIAKFTAAGANADAQIRSRKANAYYHGVVLKLMAEHSGHIAEDIHDAMCERFIPSEKKQIEFVNELTGEIVQVETDPRRSSKQSPTAFYDFVEQVREWARDFLNVDTPDPDPLYWRKRGKKAA